jgi:hypothetical protein
LNNNKQVSENNLKLQEMKNIETKISLLISQINNDLKPSEERELKLKQIKEQIDASTTELNDLQDKLIIVNTNRDNHTLTSKHTDDFIEEVFNTYVLNDQSLNISEGAKTVGASLVSSYIFMQAQVSNGEALYLHEDRGLARAGINLAEVDGHFEFEYPDKTHFEFTSLFDVMNHGYGDVNETAHRCLSEQEQLLASIEKMQELYNLNVNNAKTNLEVALYREGMSEYATRLQQGEVSDELLDEILLVNPLFINHSIPYFLL